MLPTFQQLILYDFGTFRHDQLEPLNLHAFKQKYIF